MKNLFIAFASNVEDVANEILEPSTDTRVCMPPEVIDYWLKHIEMIMEVDNKSLLGKEKSVPPLPFSPDEELVLRESYARYVLENHKMRMISSKIGWPLSFDEWWRAKADDAKDMAKYE